MKNLLKTLFLVVAIAALGVCIVQNALDTSPRDLASFSAMLIVNIILGLSSGLVTMYYNEKGLGLLRPGQPFSKSTWFRPAVLIGFDMAALGMLLPIALTDRFHHNLITQEWVFWTISPAVTALTLPVAWILIVGSICLSDRPKRKRRITTGSLCLA